MKRFLVLAACMVLLSGCTQSNIVNPESETKIADPNFDIQDDIEIDWTQVSADAESVFEDTGAYPYSKDFHFLLEPQKKEVMLVWVVSDDFPASDDEETWFISGNFGAGVDFVLPDTAELEKNLAAQESGGTQAAE